MTISIDWPTKVISVPKADLTLISGTKYELDVEAFRLILKDLEDNEDGMSYPDTHNHLTEFTLSGIVYARVIEIINGYTITFEDGAYSVSLVGANNNILDVVNDNQVSVLGNNSAGLIKQGTGLTTEQNDYLVKIVKVLINRVHTDPNTGIQTIFDDDNTPLLTAPLFEDVAGTVPYDGSAGANRRDRLE